MLYKYNNNFLFSLLDNLLLYIIKSKYFINYLNLIKNIT